MYSILNWKAAHTIPKGIFWWGGEYKERIMPKTLLPDLLLLVSSYNFLCKRHTLIIVVLPLPP